jgi:hypothetical protein
MSVQRIAYFAVAIFTIFVAGCQSSIHEAKAWNEVFQRPSGHGWTGGDGAYSVSLPAGRTLWLFGDSVIGTVKEGRRDQLEYRFGNTIAIQQNPTDGRDPVSSSITFDWGPPASSGWLPLFEDTLESAATPESLRRARANGKIAMAWAQHGIVVGSDLLLFNVIATAGDCASCGLFNFELHGSTLSVIAGVDRPYDSWGFQSGVGWRSDSRPRQRLVEPGRNAGGSGASIFWGTYVIADPDRAGALLVYGHRSDGAAEELVVARASDVERAADAMDYSRWSYWDGRAWALEPESARGILARAAFEHSVSRVPEQAGSGWAVVHAGHPLDASVHVALGVSPVGPFAERYVLRLADCPIEGFDPKQPPLVYAVKAHPELSSEDELLISLVLVRDPASSPGPQLDAGYYVPRFVRVPWDEILNHGRSSPERCEIATS